MYLHYCCGLLQVQGQKDEEPEGGALNLNQIVDVAKYLGDVGRKTVTSYIYPESHTPTHSPPIEDHSNYGNVHMFPLKPLFLFSLH